MLEFSENSVFGLAGVHRVEMIRLGVRASETVFRDHAGLDGGGKSVPRGGRRFSATSRHGVP